MTLCSGNENDECYFGIKCKVFYQYMKSLQTANETGYRFTTRIWRNIYTDSATGYKEIQSAVKAAEKKYAFRI